MTATAMPLKHTVGHKFLLIFQFYAQQYFSCSLWSQALPGDGHRVLDMGTSPHAPSREGSPGSSQGSVPSASSVTAGQESSAVPNRPGWGTKGFPQPPWTLLSSLPWQVSNLHLLLVAGDNSSCPALGIFLRDLIWSPAWLQQMSSPRFPARSLGEELSLIPVISEGGSGKCGLTLKKALL